MDDTQWDKDDPRRYFGKRADRGRKYDARLCGPCRSIQAAAANLLKPEVV